MKTLLFESLLGGKTTLAFVQPQIYFKVFALFIANLESVVSPDHVVRCAGAVCGESYQL